MYILRFLEVSSLYRALQAKERLEHAQGEVLFSHGSRRENVFMSLLLYLALKKHIFLK
jgi:hypothetical protein